MPRLDTVSCRQRRARVRGMSRRSKRGTHPHPQELDRHRPRARKDAPVQDRRIVVCVLAVADHRLGVHFVCAAVSPLCLHQAVRSTTTHSATWLWFPGFSRPTWASDVGWITSWKAHPFQHPRQRPRGVRATGETKDVYLVAFLAEVHEEAVRVAHEVFEAPAVSDVTSLIRPPAAGERRDRLSVRCCGERK